MKKQGGGTASKGKAALALGVLLALNACGLDKVDLPDLDGPAELALSLKLTASPDIVTADGFSTSLIQAQLRGPDGQPLVGRQVFMAIADSAGRTADIGTLRSTGSGGIGTGIVLTTGNNGIAQAAYEAPPRTDLTANASILVQARPVGDDFEGQVYRTVRIELRSAEPRLFPVIPDNDAPTCGFTVEPSVGPFHVNQAILFQTTSFDTDGFLVRYEWFFGDGTVEDSPDTAKVYRFTGTFVVTHVVTDNGGARAACAATFNIVP